MKYHLGVSGSIFLLATLLSSRDLFVQASHDHADDFDDGPQDHHSTPDSDFDELNNEPEEHEEPIEVRSASDFSSFAATPAGNLNSAKLQVAFCVSCGYRQAFDEFSRIVHEKYPNVEIEGSNYPPAPWKSFAAQIFGIVKIAAIIAIISGRDPFTMLGYPTPGFFTWATQNKLSSCMMLFLLGNTVETSLISTGAFEIFFNGQMVWSKLESGRIPSPGELLQIIDSQMEMAGAKTDSFGFDA
uniref:SelT-like protein n=1 Tax=Plectus sambesii TaxID=2011161 RepID=A0A914WDK6_9BILA